MKKKSNHNGNNTLVFDPVAVSVSVDDKSFWIELSDGRTLGVPLVYFPRLLNATKKQLQKFELSGGGRAIHWESLDEDISVKNLMLGFVDRSQSRINQRFIA